MAIQGLLLATLASSALAVAQTGNPAHDDLAARSQTEQRLELNRLLHEASQACGTVSTALFAGFDAARTAYWDARCREGTRYRIALPAQRAAAPGIVACAGLTPPPAGGPCFQPVQTAAAPSGLPARTEQTCLAGCASQGFGATSACLARCQQGGGPSSAPAPAPAVPANSRFGVVYHAELPLGAFGFGNGATDRLEVNMRAVRACQSQAGKTPCRFETELVNSCGALAQAIRLGAHSLFVTSDLRTYTVVRASVGTGASQAAAEQAAMARCRGAETSGVTCRIVASGC